MPRGLHTRFRALALDGTTIPRRKDFMNVTVRDQQLGHGASGAGLGLRKGLALASNVIFGKVGATVSNLISKKFGKNPEARPIFPGEQHIVLPTRFGLTRANFAGPGTQVERRVRRGDRGVDGTRGIDAISKIHDIDYVNARTSADVRRADNKMIASVKRSSAGPKTKAIVLAALKAKKLGEDIGVIDVNTFTQVTEDDNVGASGKGIESLPADRLLKKVLKKVKKKRKSRGHVVSDYRTSKKSRKEGSGATLAAVSSALEKALPAGARSTATILLPLVMRSLRSILQQKTVRHRKKRRKQ